MSSESNSRMSTFAKVCWLIVGALVGSTVSLVYEQWIKPFFDPKPSFLVQAEKESPGVAEVSIVNVGTGTASNVRIQLWVSPIISEAIDITEIELTGGAAAAECQTGIYEESLFGAPQGESRSWLDTDSRSVLLNCDIFRSSERWYAKLYFDESESASSSVMYMIKGGEDVLLGFAPFHYR